MEEKQGVDQVVPRWHGTFTWNDSYKAVSVANPFLFLIPAIATRAALQVYGKPKWVFRAPYFIFWALFASTFKRVPLDEEEKNTIK